ncbi:MAG: DUF2334 domain-containing protein [Ruminococcaceae bacterium]|nr:DUF2334 domain-containing protein [Oscillospiraceae bacterium]
MILLKLFFRAIAFAAAVILLVPANVFAASPQENNQKTAQVLLVCDENNRRAVLEELIRSTGKSVDAISESNYREEFLKNYEYLVTTINRPYRDALTDGIPTICVGEQAGPVDGIHTISMENQQIRLTYQQHAQTFFMRKPADLIDTYTGEVYGNLELFSGETIPYAVLSGNIAYLPWFQEDGLGAVVLGGVMSRLFGYDHQQTSQMYVLIDEVYPFSDLDILYLTADQFYQNGIPFIVRVMPVYDNLDYPAFHRYTQALRYVQSKGGSVVLHEPIVREYETEREPLEEKIARAKNAFSEDGVLILDMDFPPFEIPFEELKNIVPAQKNFGALPINTMIGFHLFESQEALSQAIESIKTYWLTLSDYRSVLGESTPVYNESPEDVQFVYRPVEQANMAGFFTQTNRILIAIVGISILVFVILLHIGRRINRQKFYQD